MICFRIKADRPKIGDYPSYRRKYENAVAEKERLERETNRRWNIDRVQL